MPTPTHHSKMGNGKLHPPLAGEPMANPTLESLDVRMAGIEASSIRSQDKADAFRERTVGDLNHVKVTTTELKGSLNEVKRDVSDVSKLVTDIGGKVDMLIDKHHVQTGWDALMKILTSPVIQVIGILAGAFLVAKFGLR